MDAVFTTTPRSPSAVGSVEAILAAARRRTLKVPIRLTSITLRKGSRSWGAPSLETTRWAQPIPAQLTATRNGPRREASSTARATSSGEVTSPPTKAVRSPSYLPSLSPASGLRSRMTQEAPAPTSLRTVASPSPDAPPLASAEIPFSSIRVTVGTTAAPPPRRPYGPVRPSCLVAASTASPSTSSLRGSPACPLTQENDTSPRRTTSSTRGRHRSWLATGLPAALRHPLRSHPAHHLWRKQLTT